MPETQRDSRKTCQGNNKKEWEMHVFFISRQRLLARSPTGISRIVRRDTDTLQFFMSNYTLLLEGILYTGSGISQLKKDMTPMPNVHCMQKTMLYIQIKRLKIKDVIESLIDDLITNHSEILSTYRIVHEDAINMTKDPLFQKTTSPNIVLYYCMVAPLFLSIPIITYIITVRCRSEKEQSREFLSNVKNLEDYKKSEKPPSVHYHDFGAKIDEWEVERCHLDLNQDDKLGSGNFGNVFKACSTPKEAANFFDEINLMKSLGYHERLVNMIGCITVHEPLCLIVEYCSGGDLHKYLRQKRNYMVEKQMAGIMIDPAFVYIDTLMTFAWQVACGMEYLSDKGFVHRDLAARNVLLDDVRNVKICDFGLCRTYNNENHYYTSRGGRLPIKWMALESISDYKFTSASDVWSFGILLFEIITLARCPYEGVDPCCMEKYLRRGKRMDKPLNCPDELYDLMLLSWHEEPSKRPSFLTLKLEIQNMINESADVDNNYLSLVNEDTHYCNIMQLDH
uniref:Protein kinase domain-containing protein n=1 Tax=Romanomermis culicivorax TaxID=13658 RepID=A0A915LCR8_ROMCU